MDGLIRGVLYVPKGAAGFNYKALKIQRKYTVTFKWKLIFKGE